MSMTREKTEVLQAMHDQLVMDLNMGRRDPEIDRLTVAAALAELLDFRRGNDPAGEAVDPAVLAAAVERGDRLAVAQHNAGERIRFLEARVNELHGRVAERQRQVEVTENYRKRAVAAETKVHELTVQMTDQEARLGSAVRACQEAESKATDVGPVADLLAALNEAKAETWLWSEKAAQYQEERNEVSSQLNDMTDNRDMLKAELDDLSASHDLLMEQASRAGEQRDRYLSERDRLREALQAEMADHRRMGERAVQAERRLAVLADEKAAMQRRAEAAEDDMDSLGSEFATTVASLDLARENLKVADDRVGVLDAELHRTRNIAEARSRTIIDLETRRNSLQATAKEDQHYIAELQRDRAELNARVETLNKELTRWTAAFREQEELADQFHDEREDAAEAMSRLKAGYDEAKGLIERQKAQIRDLIEQRDNEGQARQSETNRAKELTDRANKAELERDTLKRALDRALFERDDAKRLLNEAADASVEAMQRKYHDLRVAIAKVLDEAGGA